MAEQGFDFRPRERREAKTFEPPPWERDQFEELARKRAEQEAMEAEAAEARAAEARAAAEDAAAVTQESGAEDAVASEEAGAELCESTSGDLGEHTVAQEASSAPSAGLEDARVAEMLADLAIEEPPAARAYWKVGVAAGGVMIAFGAVFLFWGMAALVAARRTGSVGTFGGSVLLLFGAGFVVGGMYLVVKNLRQQGVL